LDPLQNFYFDPRQLDTRELTTGIRSLLLTHPGGETLTIDPTPTPLEIQQEHPPVERMEGDLGAICEVFKQSSTYYLRLPTIPLSPGDHLTLTYHTKPYTIILTVVELENQRARIDPPAVVANT
jgi:hypothetical protein